jgi:phosphate transport system permease protein
MTNNQKNRFYDKAFSSWGLISTFLGIALLAIFIGQVFIDGFGRISWDFLTNLPSRRPENSGIYTAMLGSVWLLLITAIIAFPIGVMAGIYLEEYNKKDRFADFLEVNISNLAGVPSIIYGLLCTLEQTYSRAP